MVPEKKQKSLLGDSGHIPAVVQGQIVFRYVEICLWLTVVCLGAGEGYACVRKNSQAPPWAILSVGDETGDYLLSC